MQKLICLSICVFAIFMASIEYLYATLPAPPPADKVAPFWLTRKIISETRCIVRTAGLCKPPPPAPVLAPQYTYTGSRKLLMMTLDLAVLYTCRHGMDNTIYTIRMVMAALTLLWESLTMFYVRFVGPVSVMQFVTIAVTIWLVGFFTSLFFFIDGIRRGFHAIQRYQAA
ncbi:hypothetical protein C8R46DRAFT_1351826 [Mycena filopes]|nr:hypothetical protein C8R46DRAFT_1351826 [Mycena filopes]